MINSIFPHNKKWDKSCINYRNNQFQLQNLQIIMHSYKLMSYSKNRKNRRELIFGTKSTSSQHRVKFKRIKKY
jgi:hypothetical protein